MYKQGGLNEPPYTKHVFCFVPVLPMDPGMLYGRKKLNLLWILTITSTIIQQTTCVKSGAVLHLEMGLPQVLLLWNRMNKGISITNVHLILW